MNKFDSPSHSAFFQDDKPFQPQPEFVPPSKRKFFNRFIEAGREGNNNFGPYVLTFLITMGGYLLGNIPIGILILVASMKGYLGDITARNAGKILNPEALHTSPWLVLLLLLFMFIPAILGLWLGIKFIHKKTFKSIITAAEKVRTHRLYTGMLVWGILSGIGLWIGFATAEPGSIKFVFDLGNFIPVVLIALLFLPIQTWWEEFMIRGWLMQGVGILTERPWVAALLTSLLFALLHLGNPEVQRFGVASTFPAYFLPGLFFALVSLLDEGLELAMGMHFINNLFGTIVITSDYSAIQASTIWFSNVSDLSSETLVLIASIAAAFTLLWLRYRWNLQKLIRSY
jgi:hypothetical protein